eukprot:COSAG06_NODE_1237_length_10134_cov_17.263777_4_plen_68_part_00
MGALEPATVEGQVRERLVAPPAPAANREVSGRRAVQPASQPRKVNQRPACLCLCRVSTDQPQDRQHR